MPIIFITEHVNVKAYVGQGGRPTTYEAMWAGLPIVGIPIFFDQVDNILRVEDRGAGLSLDIGDLTPERLSTAIGRVMTEPE